MKLHLKFELSSDSISTDYRPSIMSFIKKALSLKYSQDFDRLYQNPIMKSFTFSVFFSGGKIGSELISVPDKVMTITFSGSEKDLILKMYNAALGLKNLGYPLSKGASMRLRGARISNPQPLIKEKMAIKFLSPLLVRDRQDGKETYLTYDNSDFTKCMNLSIKNLFSALYDGLDFGAVKLTPIKAGKTVVKSDDLMFDASFGTYMLEGDISTLEILYHTGIGARRSQGFGMFEAVGGGYER